jgi:UDP-glucose 4-epimerase
VSGPRQTLVVTGASGFIGSHLCRIAAAGGWQVRAVSRKPIQLGSDVDHNIVASYREVTTTENEILIHLASERDATGTLQEKDAACEGIQVAQTFDGCAGRIIYASSSAIYADTLSGRATAESPTRDTPYARLKLAGEDAARHAGAVIVRIANVYGDGMAENCVIAEILRQTAVAESGPARVRETLPVRDFIAVQDVATGLIAVAQGTTGGTFNLGTGTGTSVRALAALILAQAGTPDREIAASNAENRSSQIVLDVEQTTASFGWRPRISLNQGLRSLIEGGDRWAA